MPFRNFTRKTKIQLTLDNFSLRAWLHGEFQPGLKFCCDYMTNFSPGWDISLGAKYEIAREMAPRTRIAKIGALLLSQFGLLTALNFQLFGMITAFKMMELKRNLSLAAYLSARKTYLQKEKIYVQARRVHRFPDSLALFNLVCIEVDVIYIPSELWN